MLQSLDHASRQWSKLHSRAPDVCRGARVISDRGILYTLQGVRLVHAGRHWDDDATNDVVAIALDGTSPALLGPEGSMMTTFLRHCLGACTIAGLLAASALVGADDGRLAQAGGGGGAGGMPSAPGAPSPPGHLGATPTPGGVPQNPGVPQP